MKGHCRILPVRMTIFQRNKIQTAVLTANSAKCYGTLCGSNLQIQTLSKKLMLQLVMERQHTGGGGHPFICTP